MGIRLDWEIEAEKSTVRHAGEDPAARQQRRRARLWFGLILLAVAGLIAGVIALAQWRLRMVDAEIEQLLRNTVAAEVTALRLGDLNAFMDAQRSASQDWLRGQTALFQEYQQLKLQRDVQFTGQILNLTIEDTRARVEVAEVIDGAQYSRLWFYWRYDDGWRHVPEDYTFWGAPQMDSADGLTIAYNAVDAPVAAALRERTTVWLTTACAALGCPSLPEVRVAILPDPGVQLGWSLTDASLLQIPSPYLRRARSDMPFDVEQQLRVGGLLTERLLTQFYPTANPIYPSDAYYLRQSILNWLTGRYAGVQSSAYLIDSLSAAYGEGAVGRVLAGMQNPVSSGAALIAQAAGVASADQARVDWRDLLTWRLRLEGELITRRDEGNFTLLYDLGDPTAAGLAAQRFNAVPDGLERTVLASELRPEADGRVTLLAQVEVDTGGAPRPEEARFRLVNGDWKRID
jgi:hypothetical protein